MSRDPLPGLLSLREMAKVSHPNDALLIASLDDAIRWLQASESFARFARSRVLITRIMLTQVNCSPDALAIADLALEQLNKW